MKKKVAVVGYGGMGQWHVANIAGGDYYNLMFPESDTVELCGVYDIDPDKCRMAADRGYRIYDSFEEVLADGECEVVVIAVPNDFHEELTVAALNAGKNVICEKPVTLSCESLERMLAAADKNGKIFSVHQNRRWDAYYIGMKKLAESGDIGDVISVESRVHGSNGVPGDWRKTKAAGGGMLYDWGVHMIDQLLWMNGWDVDRVYCHFDHLTVDEVDDGCYVDIYLKSGIRLRVEICTYNFIPLPLMYMRGRTGSALVNRWDSPIEVVRCTEWGDDDILPVRTASGLSKTMAPRSSRTIKTYKIPQPDVDVHNFYRNFCAAVDGKESQIITHDQMRTVMRVIMAAFESAETGNAVKL